MMNRPQDLQRLIRFLCLFSLVLISLDILFGCSKKNDQIRIGFLGSITGRLSSLGVDGRDGALLAVEQANAKGGVNGRPIELIIQDDKQDKEAAQKALTNFHNQNVTAVIGPLTSAMAVSITPLSNQYKLVTVGPTISTNDLCDQDDYFLRVRPESRRLARNLADLLDKRGITRLSVIYDLNNRAHCESWYQALQTYMKQNGGEIVAIEAFNSAERSSYYQLAETLLKTETQGIFILASSVDTGLISQQLKKVGFDKELFASEWSFTNDLLQMGGSAVEGITIFHTFNPSGTSPRYLKFVADYQERFGRKPSFAAAHAFDATNFVLAGLSVDPDVAHLRETLLKIEHFEGLQNEFRLNRYGDAERDLFLTTVKNGAFVLIQ